MYEEHSGSSAYDFGVDEHLNSRTAGLDSPWPLQGTAGGTEDGTHIVELGASLGLAMLLLTD